MGLSRSVKAPLLLYVQKKARQGPSFDCSRGLTAMNVTKRDKWTVIYHCYLAYFISGIVVLMFGVILPYLIEERGLSFTVAGGILSFLAIGNLASCVCYPLLCRRMSEKTAAVLLSFLYPVCL